jgi:hypothetical protein
MVGVGLVHDKYTSEVSESATDERTGPRIHRKSYFGRSASIQTELISSFFKVIQRYSSQKKGLRVLKAHEPGIRKPSLNRIWTTCHIGLRRRKRALAAISLPA